MPLRKFISGWLLTILRKLGITVVMAVLDRFITKENVINAVTGLLDALDEFAMETETDLDDKILRRTRDVFEAICGRVA